MNWSHLLSITLCLSQVLTTSVSSEEKKKEKAIENVKIKIVEAPALSRFPTIPIHGNKILTLRADPSPISGPPHLQQLSDHCYTGKDKGYTYNLCLFNNITQKEDRGGWNSFHGVLGVWHEWIIDNDTFIGMHYTMGESCDSSQRESVVLFNCSPSTRLYNFTEPKTCNYHMVLDTPLACFKGSMQVYHLLSPEQLKQWDSIEQLYYAEEITYQGLTKKRRKLLVEAGLLQEERKKERTPAPSVESPSTPHPESEILANCNKDIKKLQDHIRAIKSAVFKITKDYPSLQTKLSLVFNTTLSPPIPSPPSTSQNALSNANVPPSEDISHDHEENPDEELLTNEILDSIVDDLNAEQGDRENIVMIEKKDDEEIDDEILEALIKDIDIDDNIG